MLEKSRKIHMKADIPIRSNVDFNFNLNLEQFRGNN